MPKKTFTIAVLSGSERKALVAELIQAGRIASQGDVVAELRKQGVRVTQATASRDLQELRAFKAKDEQGLVRYALPGRSDASINSRFIVSVASSGNTVVVRTPTAAAQLLASAIDSAVANKELTGAIGTIAGDDTVLVIAATANGGAALAKKIESNFGNLGKGN